MADRFCYRERNANPENKLAKKQSPLGVQVGDRADAISNALAGQSVRTTRLTEAGGFWGVEIMPVGAPRFLAARCAAQE